MDKDNIEKLSILLEKSRFIDLSYDLEDGMPSWPTHGRFSSTTYESYDYGDESYHNTIMFSEHSGTHVDAPVHFIKNSTTIDKLSLKKLIGKAVKIDVTNACNCEEIDLDTIRKFESESVSINSGDIVFFQFGWDKKYGIQPDTKRFLKDWPGLSKEAAEYLVEKEVSAVGCDTPSVDAYGSKNPAHKVILSSGIPIIENVCNLQELGSLSFIICLPLKFKNGSASPVRLIAIV